MTQLGRASNIRQVAHTTLLTAREVSERTGYSVRTIVRWERAGKITAAHQLPGPTGALLFTEDELRKLPRKLAPETEGAKP